MPPISVNVCILPGPLAKNEINHHLPEPMERKGGIQINIVRCLENEECVPFDSRNTRWPNRDHIMGYG